MTTISRYGRSLILLTLTTAASLSATTSVVAQQTMEVMSCTFECKPTIGNTSFWSETTTLTLSNNHPPIPDASDTHVAHLLFLNGSGRAVLRSRVPLSGWDVDELHVCRMFTRANIAAPLTGSVQIALEPKSTTSPTVNEEGGFEISTHGLGGRFSVAGDDPYLSSTPTTLHTTPCSQVPVRIADDAWTRIMRTVTIRLQGPIYTQRTGE